MNIFSAISVHAVYIMLYGFCTLFSCYFFAASFAKTAELPHWIRIAFRMLGPIGLAWPVIGFIRLFASARFSSHTQNLLENTGDFFAGLGVGILLLIVFSGELKTKRKD